MVSRRVKAAAAFVPVLGGILAGCTSTGPTASSPSSRPSRPAATSSPLRGSSSPVASPSSTVDPRTPVDGQVCVAGGNARFTPYTAGSYKGHDVRKLADGSIDLSPGSGGGDTGTDTPSLYPPNDTNSAPLVELVEIADATSPFRVTWRPDQRPDKPGEFTNPGANPVVFEIRDDGWLWTEQDGLWNRLLKPRSGTLGLISRHGDVNWTIEVVQDGKRRDLVTVDNPNQTSFWVQRENTGGKNTSRHVKIDYAAWEPVGGPQTYMYGPVRALPAANCAVPGKFDGGIDRQTIGITLDFASLAAAAAPSMAATPTTLAS